MQQCGVALDLFGVAKCAMQIVERYCFAIRTFLGAAEVQIVPSWRYFQGPDRRENLVGNAVKREETCRREMGRGTEMGDINPKEEARLYMKNSQDWTRW